MTPLPAEQKPHGPPFTVERYGSFGQTVIAERDWLLEEVERLKSDSARYQWLRSHIAATIIKRFNPEETDWRPEKMDVLVDSRLHLKRPAADVPAPPCTWRTGCRDAERCKAAGCCQQILECEAP